MIKIIDSIALNEEEIQFEAVRSSGPGGQHVNKTSTAIQLRFDVAASPSLPDWLKERVLKAAGSLATNRGSIVIKAKTHRSQTQNKKEAKERLIHLINKASTLPKQRKKTRPAQSAVEARLRSKRKRGEKKILRKPPTRDD
ncbi:MAG TPA: aminoacyl-tRNA hydrolase [Candidatus Marinimicrobia bacterium]|nr:aminoacyl-tRNA hydrolase [Candidatus Neomarinimicrobiota bacterium]